MAVRPSVPQPAPDAGPGAEAVDPAVDSAAGGSGSVGHVLVPIRQPAARHAQLPTPLRTGLSRATQWRQRAHLEPIGTALRKVARHPAVVGSASAATVLVARAGVEVLRRALIEERRTRPASRVIVGRRVSVEYVEIWSRPR